MGRKGSGAALRKEANWVPFIQVRHTLQLGLRSTSSASYNISPTCCHFKSKLFFYCEQIKPKLDPWQQKFITKLKEQNSLDELLQSLSKCCQVLILI